MSDEKTVLLTGFEPFDKAAVNPSQKIAEALHGRIVAGHRIVGAVLPTTFARTSRELQRLLKTHRPALVVALGQAGGRDGISIERVAINIVDARIADNAGAQPIDRPIIKGAPAAYFSTLPIKAMRERLREAHIKAHISNTAGTFVCNQVFFALAHVIAEQQPPVRGGFIHVPFLPEQTRGKHRHAPRMTLQRMILAIRLCLDAALTTKKDLRIAAGATH